MANKSARPVVLIFLFVVLASSATALEVGGTFRFDNIGFRTDRTSADTTFSGRDYFWGGSLFLTHELSDNITLEAGFSRDDILRLLAYTLFEYQLDYFNLGLGTFLGTFNSTSQLLKSGITMSVGLELPGIVFARLRSDNSIGGRLVETGDYLQERTEVSLGFYVPNVICSLNLESRTFTQMKDSAEVVDRLTVYSLKTDIFQKNLPFRVLLTFGYQSMVKKFIDSSVSPPTKTNTLNSIILGFDAHINASRFLVLTFSLDNSVYSFGQDQLLGISNPGPGGYLFRASAGFIIDFAQLKARRLES